MFRPRIYYLLSVVPLCLLLVSSAIADTLLVPSEYATIQAAIDAAEAGDVVEIADGTYTGAGNKNLDFGGKAITVRGASGDPALCVIDCEEDGWGFHFHHGEGPDARVEALTVTRAYLRYAGAAGGAGVRCDESSPTIVNCVIRGNVMEGAGGGIGAWRSDVTVTSCTISGNTAWDCGGGIACIDGAPVITACTIRQNRAWAGGGVDCQDGTAAIIAGCAIDRNVARTSGGAVNCSASEPTFYSCTFQGNVAYRHAGGIYCSEGGDATVVNSTLRGNVADLNGGGAALIDSSPSFTNCSVSGNRAGGLGGSLFCEEASPVVTNCILWDNVPLEMYVSDGNPVVSYCDVQGGWPGEGNLNLDPRFAFTADLHLMPDSPCIDSATNDPPGGLPSTDIEGSVRPLDGNGDAILLADIGAYEFSPLVPAIAVSPPNIKFVFESDGEPPAGQILALRNSGGTELCWEITGQPEWLTVLPTSGESSGGVCDVTLSLETTGLDHGAHRAVLTVVDPNAVNSPMFVEVDLCVTRTLRVPGEYASIQAAIDAAIDGDVVELADGTYIGAGNKNLDFRGKGITVRGATDDPTLCVIDCEGDGRGVLFQRGELSDATLGWVTIANGKRRDGGGVYCDNSSPTLINCIIRDCEAIGGSGGGIFCYYGSTPTLVACTIIDNVADEEGGGVHCAWGSARALRECTISGNSTQSEGGGIYCDGENWVELVDCTLRGNSAVDEGGGIACGSRCNLTLANCTIDGNWTGSAGGGVSFSGRTLATLLGCSINENWAEGAGGGVFCEYADLVLVDCVTSGNTSSWGGGVVCVGDTSAMTDCTISGNWGGGFYCGGDATLDNCRIVDNHGYDGGGVACFEGRSLFANCSISGNSADSWGGGILCDYLGDATLANCTVTGNAADDGGGVYCLNGSPTLANCTICDNSVANSGGGVYCRDGTSPTLRNCILRGNTQPEIVTFSEDFVASYCNIQGGWPGDGNISLDPLFVDADGPDDDPNTWEDNDYHLSASSPCIDAGDPDFVAADDETDIDGQYRIWDGNGDGIWRVDMGADEFALACPGDLNGSGVVDSADLQTLLLHYGEPTGMMPADGDLNFDGAVNLADLQALLSQFGTECG